MPYHDHYDLALYSNPTEGKYPARIITIMNGVFNKNKKSTVHLQDRENSKDMDILRVFINHLGMNDYAKQCIALNNNKTKKEMQDIFFKESKEVEWDDYGMVIVIIMSHGFTGHIYDTENQQVEVDELVQYFRGMDCPKLVGKPKLFIVQADEEEKLYQGPHDVSSDSSLREEVSKTRCIPSESDFLMLWSPIPGRVWWRDWKKEGSIVFSKLKEAFKDDEFNGMELRKLMTRVLQMVCEELENEALHDFRKSGYRLPYVIDTLTKELYLLTPKATLDK